MGVMVVSVLDSLCQLLDMDEEERLGLTDTWPLRIGHVRRNETVTILAGMLDSLSGADCVAEAHKH
jgi:hypothetical protein